jgi:4-amino-4-deoxy-L-arabinose transferase-like glycosyltransferase
VTQFTSPTRSPPLAHRTLWGAAAVLERLTQALVSDPAAAVAWVVVISVALLAPLGPLTSNRFHGDEAIYSSWGLDIASGRDLLVSGSPVDKPPLFLYTQALSFVLFGPTEVAARLPSLVASAASVVLTYALGQSLYGQGVGLLAAFLLAVSPFAILFAPTAFTDPMMVTWVLAGCLAAVRGRWGWAGISLGLAAITKQQGVFFVPLAVGLAWVSNVKSHLTSPIVSFASAFLVVSGLAIGWDVARARQPGFLAQSLVSYGGLSLAPAWEKLLGFWDLLRYGTGSSVLNGVLLGGIPLLLVVDVYFLKLDHVHLELPRRGPAGKSPPQAQADLVLLAFVALFLFVHSVAAFQVWDRYLLGLIPLLALLLARILALPWRLFSYGGTGDWGLEAQANLSSSLIPMILRFLYLISALGMLSFTLSPIRDASASRFPIGGDHGAYQGVEQVVDYFQAIPADITLYHRWLGYHWRLYMWGSPYDFRAWTSPADLATQAATRPGARRYIVFPSWLSPTEARLALDDAGLSLREMHRTFRDDGSISFIVYRIEEAR